MRVVAGRARGRRLVSPKGSDTRPTSDRAREAIFNALRSVDAIDGARVADLFAGSGALGIEALSRGAASCVFVEREPAAVAVINENLERTGVAGATVVRADVMRWLAGRGCATRPGAGRPSVRLRRVAGAARRHLRRPGGDRVGP